jgi:alpha-beta hydrolase superfamily lysophospholipase
VRPEGAQATLADPALGGPSTVRPGTGVPEPVEAGIAHPTWFGPADRPLFGWFHRPRSERARLGVVLCPPVGDEERRAYLTYRTLAESLTGAGHAVLRFSYDGTGDSAGSFGDPGRVDAWTRSIAEAVTVVRSAGIRRVAVVGMRLGATLATRVASTIEPALDALVLWDPCATGREFLRHQQILLSTLSEEPLPGRPGVDTPGYHLPPDMAAELDRLTIAPVAAPGTRTLVLVRPDRPGANRLIRGLGPSAFDRLDAVGQAELLDVPPLSAVIPRPTIDAITGWLSSSAAPDAGRLDPPDLDEVTVGTDRRGRPIRERAVRLGPVGLFGITTVPEGGGSGPWMMFVNVATEHHIGPGRLWVDLSRQWARHGIRSVRFDLSGVGDSPVHPGQLENVPYARQWLDDLPALASAISPEDPAETVFIGLCSGGYGAFEAALMLGARGAYVVNPVLSAPDANLEPDPRRRALRTLPPRLARLARRHGRTAWWTWRTYRQVAPWQAPMAVCASAVRAGVDVFVVSGVADARPFREVAFWRLVGERRLRRTGRFELMTVPGMDHVLLLGEGREAAARLLTERVLDRFSDRT